VSNERLMLSMMIALLVLARGAPPYSCINATCSFQKSSSHADTGCLKNQSTASERNHITAGFAGVLAYDQDGMKGSMRLGLGTWI
jgi:hypothetical protein